MQGISTIIQHLSTDLIQSFDHPSRTMDNDMKCTHFFGLFLKFIWSSGTQLNHHSNTFKISPTKLSWNLLEQQKAAITEITSLLKHMKCYYFFPHVNNLHSMKKLEKLNTDLISLLQDYFKQTIWKTHSQNHRTETSLQTLTINPTQTIFM